MIAARRTADEEGTIGRRGLLDVAPQAGGEHTVAEQDAVGPLTRLAQQFLRHPELVFELRVPPAGGPLP